ncbi:MAG: sulfite exporter TauE/SafE family protein [Gammaproteobacteria bacterium]|nr:sulfite exporter TauE/SafE family protein [Gammaproteobacteria bacterium]
MSAISPAIAFVLGLTSTLHCWAMCGGIVGALSMGLPQRLLGSPGRHALLAAGYNLGRIASYTLAGVLFGATGGTLIALAHSGQAYLVLQILGGCVIIAIGLHLCGWLPRLDLIEGAGWRLWQWLQPVARRFLPVSSLPRALIAGAIWGWLPCGLVYSMLLWAAAEADPVRGGISMFAFGLGTLPGMMGASLAGSGLRLASAGGGWRRPIGVLIILLGLAYIATNMVARGAGPAAHDTHGVYPH